jgi:transcriptional regulator with XRE-family HTH domain
MTPEQIQEIARLRTLNLPPKQIARQLGLRPAEVSAAIRGQAEKATLARIERGELPPLNAV